VTRGLSILLAAVLVAGCGPTVDVTQALEVTEVSTGWADAGIVNGQNKLVPTITFRLKNISDQPLRVLQVNATFRRVNDPQDWGSHFLKVSGADGLQAGATTDMLTATSDRGYTSVDPRAEMLNNKDFVDAKVELAAKHGAELLAKITEFPIERRLLVK
jgi:hypothetical protein